MLIFVWNCCPDAKLKIPSKSEHSNVRYDLLKIKSNQELHIPMQIALNNIKIHLQYFAVLKLSIISQEWTVGINYM